MRLRSVEGDAPQTDHDDRVGRAEATGIADQLQVRLHRQEPDTVGADELQVLLCQRFQVEGDDYRGSEVALQQAA